MDLANVAVVTTIDTTAEGDTFAPELGYDWTVARQPAGRRLADRRQRHPLPDHLWRRTEG